MPASQYSDYQPHRDFLIPEKRTKRIGIDGAKWYIRHLFISIFHITPNRMKKLITSFCFSLLFAGLVMAQDKAPVKFAIYEDQVKPSMSAHYKENLKKLKTACDMHKADFGWTSVAFDDGTFAHLIPIKSYSDLEKNMMAGLEAKMGKEALYGIFAEFDKCIDAQTSFIASLMPEMSYLSPASDENYRDIMFWQVIPGKEMEGEKIIMEWKKLHESKKAPGGYVTYKVNFGREPGYAFVFWGKSEADMAAKNQKNNELFGEEAKKLWDRTLLITKKYYSKRAMVLSDLSYSPVAVAAH